MNRFLVELHETLQIYFFASFLKNILFFLYIFFIIYFSPQVKHVETQNDDIQTLCLEKIVFSNVLTSLHATQGDILEENSTNRSYSLQHINNLFGLLLNNLSKETVVSFHHV